jgi:predicted O-methyltransferase YrrM
MNTLYKLRNLFARRGIRGVVKIAGSYIISYPKALVEVRRPYSIDEAIDYAFYRSGSIIRPNQRIPEIRQLLNELKKEKPKVIVEIGTATGGTLFLLAKTFPDAYLISIDLPGGKYGGGYPLWKVPLLKGFSKKISLIRANSHDKKTLNILKSLVRKIDILVIDGDHTYEGVRKDFTDYSPLGKKRGIVVFHDIVKHDRKLNCGVDRYWKEIKKKYPSEEIIEDKKQKTCGIGYLRLT